MKFLWLAVPIALCCNLVSAASSQQQIASNKQPAPARSIGHDPATPSGDTVSAASSAASASQFTLGAADVFRVSVWKSAELSQTVTVGPDGFVSLPLIGDVHVAGLTARELGKVLADRLDTFIVKPQVTVSVLEIHSRQVYVLGQVAKPGGYSLVAPLTVLQLISEAGGLGTYANRKRITVLRTVDTHNTKITFNYDDVIHGNSSQNIALMPGDTVVVP